MIINNTKVPDLKKRFLKTFTTLFANPETASIYTEIRSVIYNTNTIKFYNKICDLSHRYIFNEFIDSLYNKEWVVYSKLPFQSAGYVLKYLGRYTYRVAISNNRILNIENNKVTFKWRDYKDNNKSKIMTIDATEFIRRFITHILPNKFVKIRHYGIISSRNRNIKLKKCKIFLRVKERAADFEKLSSAELFLKITGVDIRKCECCSRGNYIRKSKVQPWSTSPPLLKGVS